MLEAQAKSNYAFGARELLDLDCDEKHEFRARVERWALEVKTTTALPLGNVTFAESESAVGLQMADLFTYEARKAVTAVLLDDEERGIRDEWMELMRAAMPSGQPGITQRCGTKRRCAGTTCLLVWPEALNRPSVESITDAGTLGVSHYRVGYTTERPLLPPAEGHPLAG